MKNAHETHPGYMRAMHELWLVHQAMKPLVEGYEPVQNNEIDLEKALAHFTAADTDAAKNKYAVLLAHAVMNGQVSERELLRGIQAIRIPKEVRDWDFKVMLTEVAATHEGWPFFRRLTRGRKDA